MKKYILAYHGGNKMEDPAERTAHMNKWKTWMMNLGDTFVHPGSPLGMSKTVSSAGVENNGGSNPLMGYSIIQADSIEKATEIAKSCPSVEVGGTVEVAEVMEMKM